MSTADEETTFEFKGLDRLIKAMGAKAPTVRIGILGKGAGRSDSTVNNAEVGSFHEYGTANIPQRSFLRVPIAEHLDKNLEASGALDKDVLAETIQGGDLVPYMTKVAIVAKDIVLGAFDSGGYGKWPEWKSPGYMNNSNQLLVDTQQLRNSITYEVKES